MSLIEFVTFLKQATLIALPILLVHYFPPRSGTKK